MEEQKSQLRGALFGGFRRQDVLSCLERIEQEFRQELDEAQRQLAEERQARMDLERTVEEQGAQSTENQRLTQALQQSETALAGAREELDRKSEQLAGLERECRELKAQTEKLRPSAAAYEEMKERIAGIELDAHRRAQSIVNQAEKQAGSLQKDMERWMGQVSQGYDLMRTDMDATISHAANELARVQQALEQAGTDFDAYDRRLEQVIRAYRKGQSQDGK